MWVPVSPILQSTIDHSDPEAARVGKTARWQVAWSHSCQRSSLLMVLSHRKQHRTVTPAKELGWEILCGWADWSYHVLTASCLRLHQVMPMGFWKRKPTLFLSILGTVARPRFWKVGTIFPPSSAGPSVCSEWTVFNQCAPKVFCVSLFPSPLPCIPLYVGHSRKALFGGTSGTKSPRSFSWIPLWTVQSTESMIFAMIVKSRQAGLVPASFSHGLYLSFCFSQIKLPSCLT